MDNKFATVMARKTIEELVEILEVKSGNYLPEALDAANTELKIRKVSIEETENIVASIIREDIENEKKINTFEKLFLCLYPILTFIIIYLSYSKESYTDKREQLIKWFKYSLLFRFIIVFIFVLLDLVFA